MGASERRQKDSAMASNLVKKGIYHGKRTTSPAPNSGGNTVPKGAVGSSKYQRLQK